MTTEPDQRDLVREAKAIVALAFRNGPIEDLHAGKPCTACEGKAGYSRISDAEMKVIMKNAVNRIYSHVQASCHHLAGVVGSGSEWRKMQRLSLW